MSTSSNVTLGYDPLGRLYQVATSGGATRRFAYDGATLIDEFDGSGNLKYVYAHGPNIDEPLLRWDIAAGTWGTLQADERGSVVSLANSSGAATAINRYDECGIPGSGNTGAFQYTGQMWLPELGMYHYRARAYSPTLGRFLQTDPIGYAGGMNLHAYVGNDPVNLVDPFGLQACPVQPCEGPIIVPAPSRHGTRVIVRTLSQLDPRRVSEEQTSGLTFCPPVRTRVLDGIVVRPGDNRGGAFGVGIRNGTAAIIYRQFGMTKGELRPHIGGIAGLINGRGAFMGVTDSIDNFRSPVPGLSTQDAFMQLNPDAVILEIMGEDQGFNDFETVVFVVPRGVNCPTPTGD